MKTGFRYIESPKGTETSGIISSGTYDFAFLFRYIEFQKGTERDLMGFFETKFTDLDI